MSAALSVNAPHVVHETIDGEAILIHLVTGTYYSLDGVGAEIWGALLIGADQERLLAAARERYDADPVDVTGAVSELAQRLLGEGLLVESEPRPTEESLFPAGRVPFAAPELHTYTDMQEFMLVDPLHEVDEAAGWPHAKTG
jgi:Coenzyme PQQ synthesis protein D (PqqD)